jgi:hypothetical protein
MRSETNSHIGGPQAAETTCPRCGSPDVRQLSLIHVTGLPTAARNGRVAQSALSRSAAPPVKKHAVLWSLLSVVAAVVATTTFAVGGSGPVVVAAVAVLAAAFAVRAARYNAKVYPELRRLWERSFMCTRCGDVFSN